jgi:hypothetical protein
MTQKERLESVLFDYVPPTSAEYIADQIVEHKIAFRIAKTRKSKLGDYRPPFREQGHRISVNHDLNPYQFLITTIHEIAHLITWEQHKNKVKSHGREWQHNYVKLLQPLLNDDVFPDELLQIIQRSNSKPAASSCSDPELSIALQKYDDDDGLVFVRDIPSGATFELQGRLFKKGKLIRKRYKCLNVQNKREYLVNALSRARQMN